MLLIHQQLQVQDQVTILQLRLRRCIRIFSLVDQRLRVISCDFLDKACGAFDFYTFDEILLLKASSNSALGAESDAAIFNHHREKFIEIGRVRDLNLTDLPRECEPRTL